MADRVYFNEYEQRAVPAQITLTIDPHLQQRIRMAATKKRQTIDEFLQEILDSATRESTSEYVPQTPLVTNDPIERLQRMREHTFQSNRQRYVTSSVTIIRLMREERIKQLEYVIAQ